MAGKAPVAANVKPTGNRNKPTDDEIERLMGAALPDPAVSEAADTLLEIQALQGGLDLFDEDRKNHPEIIDSVKGEQTDIFLATYLQAEPLRLSITDVDEPRHSVTFTNPTEFEDSVEAEWVRHVSPGSSYSRLHYVATKNYNLEVDLYSGFNLLYKGPANEAEGYWQNSSGVKPQKTREYLDYQEYQRNSLLSWVYPVKKTKWSESPPLLHVFWKRTLDFQGYLLEVKFRNLKFGRTGGILRWVATCKFEAIPNAFISSEDIWGGADSGDMARGARAWPGHQYRRT